MSAHDHARSVDVEVVIPTVGRASLAAVLDGLARDASESVPRRVILVDDRRDADGSLPVESPDELAGRVVVVPAGGRGPAAARNAGWRSSTAPWVAFLDDDVLIPTGWSDALQDDLAGVPPDVAGSQGNIEVPLPSHRRPTDWERNVAGLADARWATADMAYRRDVLEAVGGFDERFPRAYREDADLALRVQRAGYALVRGRRRIVHPVRSSDALVSLRLQAGNADDPLMRALHGRGWRAAAGVARGRRRRHLATVAAAVTAVGGAAGARPAIARGGATVWALLTGELLWRRIAPGPRTWDEIARMTFTSLLLPFAAVGHWLRGIVGLPARVRRHARRPHQPAAILFDRDGTLVHDVPYNGDPARVRPVDGARAALQQLRSLGVPTAVVSNQSGVARGLLTRAQLEAVNERLEQLLGPLGPIEVCPHDEGDGCGCRKPAPGLIQRACRRLGVDPRACIVIGDTGADVAAARAAGARGILVPTPVTRREEVATAPLVATDLTAAVALALRTGGAT